MLNDSVCSWLTISAAAKRLGVSPERVRQVVRLGRLNYVSTPYGRLIDPFSLDEYRVVRDIRRAVLRGVL